MGRSGLEIEREWPCRVTEVIELRVGGIAEAIRDVLLAVFDRQRVCLRVSRIREDEVEDHRDRPECQYEEQDHEQGHAEDARGVVLIDLVAARDRRRRPAGR